MNDTTHVNVKLWTTSEDSEFSQNIRHSLSFFLNNPPQLFFANSTWTRKRWLSSGLKTSFSALSDSLPPNVRSLLHQSSGSSK